MFSIVCNIFNNSEFCKSGGLHRLPPDMRRSLCLTTLERCLLQYARSQASMHDYPCKHMALTWGLSTPRAPKELFFFYVESEREKERTSIQSSGRVQSRPLWQQLLVHNSFRPVLQQLLEVAHRSAVSRAPQSIVNPDKAPYRPAHQEGRICPIKHVIQVEAARFPVEVLAELCGSFSDCCTMQYS